MKVLLVETDPMAVRRRVVVLLLGGRPAALLCRTALGGEGPRGRPLGVGAVERVRRLERTGWVMAVGSVWIGPGGYLHNKDSLKGAGESATARFHHEPYLRSVLRLDIRAGRVGTGVVSCGMGLGVPVLGMVAWILGSILE